MKKALLGISIFKVFCFYAMERDPLLQTDISNQAQRSIQEITGEMESIPLGKTTADLTLAEWKKGAINILDLSNLSLNAFTALDAQNIQAITSKFQTLDAPPVVDFTNITAIDISHNNLGLNSLNFDFFKGLNHIESFNASHNKFGNIDIAIFFRVFPKIKHLNLSHNNIDDNNISWSEHAPWEIFKQGSMKTFIPTINLANNPIVLEKTKSWLITRYKDELRRASETSITMASEDCFLGAFSCTFLGLTTIGVPIKITTCSSLGFKIAGPVGCALGCLFGACASYKGTQSYRDDIITKMNIPLYFQEPTQAYTSPLEMASPKKKCSIINSFNTYACGQCCSKLCS